MTAVIIDDERDICTLLHAALKNYGIHSSFASTLRDGLAMVDDKNPGLVFLDVNLPDGSGLAGLHQIRKKYPAIKVIMISAYDSDRERRDAKEIGAYDFLGKPFDVKKVYRTIDTLL